MIGVDLQFPREIYANRSCGIKVTLSNKRRYFPVFVMRTRFAETFAFFPFVDRNSEATAHVPVSFSRRGRVEISRIYLESRFPFNFFVRSRKIDNASEVLVFPEPLACDPARIFTRGSGSRGESSGRHRGEGSDLLLIREYIPGDPLRYINWKASAKTGGLKTTETAAPSERPVTIDFDSVEIKDLEEKISCITFVVLNLLKRNIPVGLRIGSTYYSPAVSDAHRVSIMKELALYDPDR